MSTKPPAIPAMNVTAAFSGSSAHDDEPKSSDSSSVGSVTTGATNRDKTTTTTSTSTVNDTMGYAEQNKAEEDEGKSRSAHMRSRDGNDNETPDSKELREIMKDKGGTVVTLPNNVTTEAEDASALQNATGNSTRTTEEEEEEEAAAVRNATHDSIRTTHGAFAVTPGPNNTIEHRNVSARHTNAVASSSPQEAVDEAAVDNEATALDHIDEQLDRLGIYRVDAEAVPVAQPIDIEEGGLDRGPEAEEAPSSNNGSDDHHAPAPIEIAQAKPIPTTKCLGRELQTSHIKYWLLVALALAIGIVVPVAIITSQDSNTSSSELEDKNHGEKELNPQAPLTETELEAKAFRACNKAYFLTKDPSRCYELLGGSQYANQHEWLDELIRSLSDPKSFEPVDDFENFGKSDGKTNQSPQIGAEHTMHLWFHSHGDKRAQLVLDKNEQWFIDEYVLHVLYHSTSGKFWSRHGGSDPKKSKPLVEILDHCSDELALEGMIVCNDESEIIELNLGRNNLEGNLPDEIQQMKSLQRLTLVNNPLLQGKLPLALNKLVNLQYMRIDGTKVTGSMEFFCQESPVCSSGTSDCWFWADLDRVDCSCCLEG